MPALWLIPQGSRVPYVSWNVAPAINSTRLAHLPTNSIRRRKETSRVKQSSHQGRQVQHFCPSTSRRTVGNVIRSVRPEKEKGVRRASQSHTTSNRPS